MCPSQLVKMYDPVTKGKTEETADDEEDGEIDDLSENIKKYGKEVKFHHIIKRNGTPGKKIPQYI